jgi:dienelactone hydrolase
MAFLQTLDRWRARVVDDVSFGAVNLLQMRHVLPADYSQQLDAYVNHWRSHSLDEYLAIPPFSPLPAEPWPSRLRFASPLAGPQTENNHAVFDLYPCAEGWTAPTMLLAHGLMSVSDVGYRWWAKQLNQCGWNAVFAHLPYHYSRRPAGACNGELAISPYLIRNVEGARQSVLEIRLLFQALAARGCPYFGAWGTSYGGWISALLACVEPRVQRLLLVEPILKVEKSIWESPATAGLRVALRRAGIRPHQTEPHSRLCCPTRLQPLTPPDKIILVAGDYDQIAPPGDVRELHQAWAGSHFASWPQGHVGYALMPAAFRLAREKWGADLGRTTVPNVQR